MSRQRFNSGDLKSIGESAEHNDKEDMLMHKAKTHLENEVIGSPKTVEKVPGDAVPVLAEEELLGVDDNKRKKLPNDQDEGSLCHRHTPCKERCYQKGPHKTESPSPQWFGRNGQDTRKARIILHEEH